MSEEGCACEATSILVFPCSGSSNVGQIANAVGIELTRRSRTWQELLAAAKINNYVCTTGFRLAG